MQAKPLGHRLVAEIDDGAADVPLTSGGRRDTHESKRSVAPAPRTTEAGQSRSGACGESGGCCKIAHSIGIQEKATPESTRHSALTTTFDHAGPRFAYRVSVNSDDQLRAAFPIGTRPVGLHGCCGHVCSSEHTAAKEVNRCTGRRGCLLPLPRNRRVRCPTRLHARRLLRFAHKPIEKRSQFNLQAT